MKKFNWFLVYINIWRIVPAYFCMKNNKMKTKCEMDLAEYQKAMFKNNSKKNILEFGYIILHEKSYRNVLQNRLHRNIIKYMVVRILFRPLESLYINMPPEKIGGGLYFQHGFSTIVTAKEIGERCHINQQVTIGYKGKDAPIIGDGCIIMAGAIVVGNVKINNGGRCGAGSVVTKDVPKDTVVVGVPARAIKNS